MRTSLSNLFAILVISLAVSACGKQVQIVSGIQVQSSTVGSDVNLALKADLDLGNMSFPAVTLPILHPSGQAPIGSVELVPVLGGKNQIKISLNVSAVSDLRASIVALPNGNSVPLIAANPTITIALGAGAKLYLTIGANAVALGVAIPIKSFDGIGASVGNINLFPVFNIDRVLGAAGIFTGSQAGQNGFALVADVTQYVNLQDVFAPQQAADLMRSAVVVQEDAAKVTLNFSSHKPVKAKEDKINSMLLDLNNKKKKLELKK